MGKESWTEAQREVWAMEEKYLHALQSGDFDLLMALCHQDFLAWTGPTAELVTKQALQAGEAEFRRPRFVALREEPVAVQVLGDVAMTYAIWSAEGTQDGQKVTHRGRLTHTWLKQGATWVMVGGMLAPFSAPLQKEES